MPKTILIADDEPDILETVGFRLEKLGYKVISAPNGLKALEMIQSQKPDLVVLDYWMPEMTGEQVFERVRADQVLRNIPVIFVTGRMERTTLKSIVLARANGYLLKPFEFEELAAHIRTTIG